MSYFTIAIKHEAMIDAKNDFNNDSTELLKHACRLLKDNKKLLSVYEDNYGLRHESLSKTGRPKGQ